MRGFRTLFIYLVLVFLTLSLANYVTGEVDSAKAVSYSEFVASVEAGQVKEVTVVDQSVTGRYEDNSQFKTTIPANDADIFGLLRAKGVKITIEPPPRPPWWMTLLTTILPMVLVAGVFFYLLQQSQGGGNRVMQFGRSRARLHTEEKRKITFADLGGVDEVKDEMAEMVDFLKHPKRYLEIGARIPKGVLLVGPPGTGKTHLARAVAGEAGVPFFSISGSDFVEMFVGVGASRVRDLFETAKKHSPCIVFIDEIDAVGRQRGAGYGGGHDEREQTLNQLLVEMDGFGVNEGIIVLAATNRPDVLDPALLRPGRFDRQIVIDRPDVRGREQILRIHAKNKPLADDVDLERMAKRTPGFTGADLETLLNEGALLAARNRRGRISMEELSEAVDRVVAGPQKKSRVISEKQKKVVAYHESGHALVARLLPDAQVVQKITLIPRGQALGYVLHMPTEDRYVVTKTELLNQITVGMAGRAAEELIFGEMSTGAHDDLEKATKLARKMVTEYGMSEKLGPLTFGNKQDQVFLGRDIARDRDYSDEVAAAIDREVQEIIGSCYRRAQELISANRHRLERVAEALLERETLEEADLEELIKD